MMDQPRNGHATGRDPLDSPERDAMHSVAESLRQLAAALHDRDLPVQMAVHVEAVICALTDQVRSADERDYASERFHSSGFADFSPVAGLANPVAPPLRMSRQDDGSVTATAVFSRAFEGPPGHVHGGVLSAAFDEVLGLAQFASGSMGMTGRLTVHYRRPTPIDVDVHFTGWVDSVSGRKVTVKGESRVFFAGEWLVTAEADGLFISLPDGFRTLAGSVAPANSEQS